MLFVGLALLYHRFGTLDIRALQAAAETVEDKRSLYPAGLCVLFGFGAKAGLFPLHVWLPKAHPVAPAPASALLSGALTKIGLYGVTVITVSLFRGDAKWGSMLFALAVITLFLGALAAICSNNLKKILACSSMSQIGFATVGIALSATLASEGDIAAAGAVWHMFNHSILKLTLFVAAGAVYMNLHALRLDEIRGFGRRKPLLMAAFAFGGLGLGGIPLFNGYLSKTMLHEAITLYAETTGSFWIHAAEWVFLLTGGLTLAYMTKIFVCLFVEKPSEAVVRQEKRRYMAPLSTAALAISAVMIPLMGIPRVMRFFLGDAMSFAGGEKLPDVAFFSPEALSGALITLTVAAAAYFLFVFLPRKKTGGYPDLWPEKLDLEDRVYRPLLLGILPRLGGAVFGVFARFPEKVFETLPLAGGAAAGVLAWIPEKLFGAAFLGGGAALKGLSELPDRVFLFTRKTVLREKKAKTHPRQGTLLTEAVGRTAEKLTRRKGATVALEKMESRIREELSEVGAGFSFALLLAALGLCAMLLGLLLF